jgi:hypothetical protein
MLHGRKMRRVPVFHVEGKCTAEIAENATNETRTEFRTCEPMSGINSGQGKGELSLFDQKIYRMGARGSVVVAALCYKPEGRRFQTP